MYKSLILIKEKKYDECEMSTYVLEAKVVNSSEEVMESLPIFVKLSLQCESEFCDNLVEGEITIKTSRKIYKIVSKSIANSESIPTNLSCLICSDDMTICGIEIVSDEDYTKDMSDYTVEAED